MATTTASLDSGVPTKVTPKVPKKKTTITANTKLPPNPFVFEVLELANKQKQLLRELKYYKSIGILH